VKGKRSKLKGNVHVLKRKSEEFHHIPRLNAVFDFGTQTRGATTLPGLEEGVRRGYSRAAR
jgi:hypothetical protein